MVHLKLETFDEWKQNISVVEKRVRELDVMWHEDPVELFLLLLVLFFFLIQHNFEGLTCGRVLHHSQRNRDHEDVSWKKNEVVNLCIQCIWPIKSNIMCEKNGEECHVCTEDALNSQMIETIRKT